MTGGALPRHGPVPAALTLLRTVLACLCIWTAMTPVAGASKGSVLSTGVKLMNYYPASDGWSYMWTRWHPAVIDADFQRIAALHANTVRVTIPAGTFGYPLPHRTMLDRLAQVLRLAHKDGLRVQLTLFDWWWTYRDIAGSQQWVSAVLAPYAGMHSVAFVELRNEIDPTDLQAMAWARAMIPYVRSVDGLIPVTLSVSGQDSLRRLKQLVVALRATPPDFYTFHFYSQAPLAYGTFKQAERVAAPTPLLIGEVGVSTCTCYRVRGLQAAPKALEAYQDHYYRTVEYATRSLGLPPAAPWILYDFRAGAVPDTVSGQADYQYGLFHGDGKSKPAAATLRAFFGGGQVNLSFNNSFEHSFVTKSGRLPTEWRIDQASEGDFALGTKVARSGKASARISNSRGDGFAAPAFYISPIEFIVPGQMYSASVWARGLHATGTTQLVLDWFDASSALVAEDFSAALPQGTTKWTRLEVSAGAPPHAAYVEIRLESAFNRGTAWFDDVSFNRLRQDRSPSRSNPWPVLVPAVRAGPAVVAPGRVIRFRAILRPLLTLSHAIIDFDVVDANWVKVDQSYQTDVNLIANSPQQFTTSWKVPSTTGGGIYRLVVYVFNSTWTKMYGRNQATTFTIGAASP